MTSEVFHPYSDNAVVFRAKRRIFWTVVETCILTIVPLTFLIIGKCTPYAIFIFSLFCYFIGVDALKKYIDSEIGITESELIVSIAKAHKIAYIPLGSIEKYSTSNYRGKYCLEVSLKNGMFVQSDRFYTNELQKDLEQRLSPLIITNDVGETVETSELIMERPIKPHFWCPFVVGGVLGLINIAVILNVIF